MDQLGGMIWDLKGYFFVGGAILAAGIAVLLAGRAAGGESARNIRWIAFPVIGCGGCLFVFPLFSVFGGLVMALGVVAFCQNAASC
jgi:hypothetical protein